MAKKDKEEDIEELEDEDDELDDFDEEEDEEPVKKRKGKLKSKDWIIQHSPEMWTVLDPRTKEVVAQSQDIEMLRLQLQVIAAQKSSESSKQTE